MLDICNICDKKHLNTEFDFMGTLIKVVALSMTGNGRDINTLLAVFS